MINGELGRDIEECPRHAWFDRHATQGVYMNFTLFPQVTASQAVEDGAGTHLLTSNMRHQRAY